MASHVRAEAFAVSAALLVFAPGAAAYSYQSAVTPGCHEPISSVALRTARSQLTTLGTLPPTASEQAFIADLPFDVEPDMRDLAGAALLVGIRDVDLEGREALDGELAQLHGDPGHQASHCLRRPEHDEPNGSRQALEETRAVIRSAFAHALDALDASGKPDPNVRDRVSIFLDFAGPAQVDLPAFYVRMGPVLHPIQDSFTHTYRTADSRRITVVLNWVDFANGDLDEARDGPRHLADLDHCDDEDELRKQRHALALEASTEALLAALDVTKSREQKMADLESVLDRHLSYQDGCTYDNDWCDAPERALEDEHCACRAVGRPGAGSLPALLALSLLGVAGRRRRASARASAAAAAAALAVRAVSAAQAPAPQPAERSALGVYAAAGASYDRPSLAFSAALRMRLNDAWLVGIDEEWNPWWSLETQRIRPGTSNSYATGIRRWSMHSDTYRLRSSLHLGASLLLFELYGAPKWSVGPYVGMNVIGLEIAFARSVSLVIDPADVAVVVPHVQGAPLVYREYRFTVGLQWGA